MVLRPFLAARAALAEVVHQAGPAHRQRLVVFRALAQYVEDVHAGIHFRMVRSRLRYAEQRIDFRQQHRQRATVAQHLEEHVRTRFHQRAGDFLPAALGGERFELARAGQLTHQRQGFVRDTEAERRIARGKAGDTQHAQGIFGECRGNVAQQAGFEVALAAVGIDHPAVLVLGHGVDGQVAAHQVVFQADVRAGVEGEAAVALAALALGTRQGVLLAGLRVQEDREVRADRAETPGEHFIASGADHHPVDIGDRPAEQPVAHGAANFVDLHGNPPL
ncbi:hypothetical protein D3C78_939080 [compost metagenome]